MSESSKYSINLKSIGLDKEQFVWTLDDDFFAGLDQELISRGSVRVTLRVIKTSGNFRLLFDVEGQVTVPCDRCLEPMQQPVQGAHELSAVLGETYQDDGDVITVPDETGIVNLAWNLYEIVALLIPIAHVHPEGQCNTDMAQLLSRHTAQGQTDHRWDALKALKSPDQ